MDCASEFGRWTVTSNHSHARQQCIIVQRCQKTCGKGSVSVSARCLDSPLSVTPRLPSSSLTEGALDSEKYTASSPRTLVYLRHAQTAGIKKAMRTPPPFSSQKPRLPHSTDTCTKRYQRAAAATPSQGKRRYKNREALETPLAGKTCQQYPPPPKDNQPNPQKAEYFPPKTDPPTSSVPPQS